jgi:hypothetical protein
MLPLCCSRFAGHLPGSGAIVDEMALFTLKIGTKRLLRLHLFVTGAPIWCYEIGVVG